MFRSRRALLESALGAGLVALALALAGGLYHMLKTPARPATGGPETRPARHASAAAARKPITPSRLSVVWRGRDPAREPVVASKTISAATRAQRRPPAPRIRFKVRGIIYEPGGDSVAFIESGKSISLQRRGDVIEGWRVLAVDMSAVTFTRNGRAIRLKLQELPFARRTAASQPEGPAEDRTLPAGVASGADRFGRKRVVAVMPASRSRGPARVIPDSGSADATVAIPRDLVASVRKDPIAAVRRDGVKFSINVRDGKMAGVTIGQVPRGSLAARYGFTRGDKILAVNGQPLDSPSRLFDLYNRHRNSNSVTVTLERSGRRKDVMFYAR